MKKPLSIWMQGAVCAGIAAVFLAVTSGSDLLGKVASVEANGASGQRAARNASGVPVIVRPVVSIRDTLRYETVGTGVASRSVMLRAEVEGEVDTSNLAAGKKHSGGDVLLTLEDRDQQLALQLAQTRARQAERDRERLADLLQRGITPETVYQDSVTAAELAQLELERARVALSDREVRAPFDGVSGLPAVEPGDRVEAGAELASFDDRTRLMVEFDLPEALLSRVSLGKPINARSPSVPNQVFVGEIVSIGSRIDPASRTVKVRVEIPNKEDLLRPGASFTLAVNLEGADYPAVPELALQFSQDALYVWRIGDAAAERVEVALIRRQAGNVLVDGPLAEGDLIAIEGMQRLSPGRAVEILGSKAGAD
ncbi:MAG: efflux RND transporter periplasmic adaptor subunit [Pseudomonadota bacterium]